MKVRFAYACAPRFTARGCIFRYKETEKRRFCSGRWGVFRQIKGEKINSFPLKPFENQQVTSAQKFLGRTNGEKRKKKRRFCGVIPLFSITSARFCGLVILYAFQNMTRTLHFLSQIVHFLSQTLHFLSQTLHFLSQRPGARVYKLINK